MTRREVIDWLRSRRESLHLTQREIEDAIVGKGRPHNGTQVRRWENYHHDTMLETVIAYADVVGAEIIIRVKE